MSEYVGRELFAMSDRWFQGDDPFNDARSALEGLVAVYVHHGPVLRALADAAGADAQVEQAYRGLVQEFIDATARHIRDEQARGVIGPLADVDETARALIWMEERYISEALGRTPQADPQFVVDVLTTYGCRLSTGRRRAADQAWRQSYGVRPSPPARPAGARARNRPRSAPDSREEDRAGVPVMGTVAPAAARWSDEPKRQMARAACRNVR
jgi:hypothetical protein